MCGCVRPSAGLRHARCSLPVGNPRKDKAMKPYSLTVLASVALLGVAANLPADQTKPGASADEQASQMVPSRPPQAPTPRTARPLAPHPQAAAAPVRAVSPFRGPNPGGVTRRCVSPGATLVTSGRVSWECSLSLARSRSQGGRHAQAISTDHAARRRRADRLRKFVGRYSFADRVRLGASPVPQASRSSRLQSDRRRKSARRRRSPSPLKAWCPRRSSRSVAASPAASRCRPRLRYAGAGTVATPESVLAKKHWYWCFGPSVWKTTSCPSSIASPGA